jgi:hypothetical protein
MLKHRTSACCGYFADYLLAALRIQIRRHYCRAFPGKAQSGAAAYPARRTGEHRYFSIKSAHGRILSFVQGVTPRLDFIRSMADLKQH